jgi:anti-anti-sigma factor
MLRIDIHAVHPNVTLRCSGRIVLGLEAETLRYMATSRKESCITLNLGGICAIDAAGLGLLVELQCWANHRMKALRIAEPSACVRKLIALTNLQSVLRIGGCEQVVDFEEHERAVSATLAERVMSA